MNNNTRQTAGCRASVCVVVVVKEIMIGIYTRTKYGTIPGIGTVVRYARTQTNNNNNLHTTRTKNEQTNFLFYILFVLS